MSRVWLITGISSGFGKAITEQLLEKGETVVGTVRTKKDDIKALEEKYPDNLDVEHLDVTNTQEIREVVNKTIQRYGKIDVLVNNAGYGLFGAAEELSDKDIDLIIATNLTGSIQMIRAVLPYMRAQKSGHIIQISSYGGQVAYAGNSLYHATKFGIEGFCESVAQEIAPFNIKFSIIEPGGARTEFRYGSAHVANLMPEYDNTMAHAFLKMLDPENGLAPGDPNKMASRIIEVADKDATQLHLVLGSQALQATIDRLSERLNEYQGEKDVAKSTDIEEDK
ncbi:SDR family oxidoreductase [Lactobacillus johnsonii]|uniref:SDR family oxidoreductase n=1 Tax=Lactobacillus johnsonii TaxID=33959 RepID=UPI0028E769A1|nr:SDR family oxidoreductase [Lactobacillus johnsonii]MDT9605519.1 SDR family oxidoreductase [Lactobacillus johnsonii]